MALLHETAPVHPEMRECAYNHFRNNERTELFCAVPEDRPVPDLIVAGAWTFERTLRPDDVAPPGLHERGEGWRAVQRLLRFSGHGPSKPNQAIRGATPHPVSVLRYGQV